MKKKFFSPAVRQVLQDYWRQYKIYSWRTLIAFLMSVVAIAFFLAFSWFFKKSRMGVAMRAVADNQQVAQAMGINVERYFALAWAMAGVVPDIHKPQMVVQCACTGRKWCDFVAFDPRIRDPRRRLFIRRYEPTAEEVQKIETAAETFLAELDAMWDAFHSAAA